MLERSDNERRDERRRDGAEDDRPNPVRRTAKAIDDENQNDSPHAAPERERDYRRNSKRRHRLHRPGTPRREVRRVQERKRDLMESDRGEKSGDETEQRALH